MVTSPLPHVVSSAEPAARPAVRVVPTVPHAGSERETLRAVLKERFGFSTFRTRQDEVCERLVRGEDVLLVMPTGGGKSLCYQLPGLVRRALNPALGSTVVVSPLIALMEDQVSKLQALGFSAERIHSGCSRENSREACRRYLAGTLDFLFFAPERLSVPGFPEMLGRRPPALVAVDEAHCISHWGHDFRPDYRRLHAHLPRFRPAPTVALTATATPRVQDDICAQLGLGIDGKKPARIITGFRRTNIAMEVVECQPRARRELAAKVLADPNARPAILYAPSRKVAEETAAEFADEGLSCAAYHAGMTPDRRAGVQRAFLSGELEVIVATIAFGMGIDKANVRSVLHLALPASLEAYSQEIGRAGRDGKPSRAVLLTAFSDRRTHEFFLDRDYPRTAVLRRLASSLGESPVDQDSARRNAGLSADDFAAALEKLWVHGGVVVEQNQDLRRGTDTWVKPYEAQRAHKEEQLDRMQQFVQSARCRVLSLLQHFGDTDDGGPCGICDVCAPESCVLLSHRGASDDETAWAERIMQQLAANKNGVALGKLFGNTAPGPTADRREFDNVVRALERAGALALERAVFEKDGERIPYQRAVRTSQSGGQKMVFVSRDEAAQKKSGKTRTRKTRTRATEHAAASPRRGTHVELTDDAGDVDPRLIERLRAFRLDKARAQGVPAFRIFSDATLLALAQQRPQSAAALLAVRGMGQRTVDREGAAILALLAQ